MTATMASPVIPKPTQPASTRRARIQPMSDGCSSTPTGPDNPIRSNNTSDSHSVRDRKNQR
eukprot:8141213-Alexandrium_andersonii.AAC.1